MDQTQAFVKYGQMLDEAQDWLEHGYKREHPTPRVIPPAQQALPAYVAGKSGTGQNTSSAIAVRVNDNNGALRIESNRTAQLVGIAHEIASCRACDLYLTRKHTVPGMGSTTAFLMVLTTAPSDTAHPESGPLSSSESEYLERWFSALGLHSSRDVFITPVVKCRTPGGRPPRPAEMNACHDYLLRQYRAVRPKALLVLGATACAALTGKKTAYHSLVGRDWTWNSLPALVLWTPAEVLANPVRLRKPVWEGLQRLKASWNALS